MPRESVLSPGGRPAGDSDKQRLAKSHWLGSFYGWIFLIVVFSFPAACVKNPVYIPPEWQTAPPKADTAPASKSTAQKRPKPYSSTSAHDSHSPNSDNGGSSGNGGILKPPPKFEEKDISASASVPAPVPAPLASQPPGSQAQPHLTEPASPPPLAPQPAPSQGTASGSPGGSATQPGNASPKPKPPASPQAHASMHLVDTAKTSLAHGNADQAISLLEQAIQVDVYNGEAFYLLAQAWRRKGSLNKSLGFARKAEVLFQSDKQKLKQVLLFEADLLKEKGDPDKANAYRQKAGKL